MIDSEDETEWEETPVGDLVNRALAREEEIRRICRVEDGAIRIEYPNGADDYVIGLERCDTPEKILNWVVHLLPKKWIQRDILEHFVIVACGAHGIKIFPEQGGDC